MVRQLSLAVVGVDYKNLKPRKRGQIPRRFEIAACAPGETVTLEPEPDNPADPNAVMVFSARGIQIGYVKAERALLIHRQWRNGADICAVFQEATDWGAVIRVTFDGSAPELPAPRDRPPVGDNDHGFYPDYLPPDD
ncbi:hypothetical protein EIK56_17950 [Sphingomonas sp. C8-2]|nr:hypothetical protein EIK56_17950 [Sphingomonas sp. C8-2]